MLPVSFCLILAAWTCLLGTVLLCLGMLEIRRGRASRHWPTAEGIVCRSAVIRSSFRWRRWRWWCDFRYRYNVRQQMFEGNRIYYGSQPGTVKASLAMIKPLPVGARVVVHYDPRCHGRCVLQPGDNRHTWTVLGNALVMFLLSALFVWLAQ